VPHVDHFLAEPLAHLPARRPDSIRRTSHIDMITHGDGLLELRGMAHQGGMAHQDGATATCRALVMPAGRELHALELHPALPASGELLGLGVGRGFRGVVDQICEAGTLTHLLLSELPVAALLSGYGYLYTGRFATPLSDDFIAHLPVDICAGWASPASFMTQIRSAHEMPAPSGPVAPADDIDDIAGWHHMPPLAPGSMRRQRLIDRDGPHVWAMFRDTYCRPDGVVTVLHEYSVDAIINDGAFERCVATPHVLPWTECPEARASAGRLVGRPLSSLRQMVKDDMVGTSTCTHLNDLLSSLAQAEQLV
jgi:hypothetical protein